MVIQRNRLSNESGSGSELESRVMLAGDYSHNFNNGNLGEFHSNNLSNTYLFPNGNSFAPYFKEAEYDGTRDQRGFEIRHGEAGFFTGNADMSHDFLVPRTNASSPFPDDKETIVHQWYNWGGPDRPNNWAAHLKIKDNDLYATYRAGSVTGTEVLIKSDLPRGQYMNIEQFFQPGLGDGEWKIEIDGETVLDLKDENIGWNGTWNSDGSMGDGQIGMKTGMYAHDVNNYEEGEERYLRYDNISISSSDSR